MLHSSSKFPSAYSNTPNCLSLKLVYVHFLMERTKRRWCVCVQGAATVKVWSSRNTEVNFTACTSVVYNWAALLPLQSLALTKWLPINMSFPFVTEGFNTCTWFSFRAKLYFLTCEDRMCYDIQFTSTIFIARTYFRFERYSFESRVLVLWRKTILQFVMQGVLTINI
jgi:hypothetical protein